MKRTIISLFAFCMSLTASAQGFFGDFFFGQESRGESDRQNRQDPVSFVYDLDFQYRFDNREFARSGDAVTPSMTTNAAVLTPMVGFRHQLSRGHSRRVMAGANLTHHMGTATSLKDTPVDLMLFYNSHIGLGAGSLDSWFGSFPRNSIKGDYGEAFFSDSLKFYDPMVEGMLFSFGSPVFNAELGLDWMGQKGVEVKERFQIYSSGSWVPLKWLSLGWAASMYHYAGSVMAPGVVDNHLFNPWAKLDFSAWSGLQKLYLKAGLLATYQWDRKFDDSVHAPLGGELVFNAQACNFGVKATMYMGQNLLYYYSGHDAAGNKYGNMLYRGSPFYTGTYGLGELYWRPWSSSALDLLVDFRFHVTSEGYAGCQQVLELRWNMEASKARKPRAVKLGKLL